MYYAIEHGETTHLHSQLQCHYAVSIIAPHAAQIYSELAQHLPYGVFYTYGIVAHDCHHSREQTTCRPVAAPFSLEHPVREPLLQDNSVATIFAVYGNAVLHRHEGEYVIAIYWRTTLAQLIVHIAQILAYYQTVAATLCTTLLRRSALLRMARDIIAGHVTHQHLFHIRHGEPLIGYHGIQLYHALEPVALNQHIGYLLQRQRYLPVLGLAFELLAPQTRTRRLLFTHISLYAGTSLACHHECQPIGLGALRLDGGHLHQIAAVQHLPYGHVLMVYTPAHAHISEIGVYFVGEVEQGGPTRQLTQISGWREYYDLGITGRRLCIEVDYVAIRFERLQSLAQTLQPLLAAALTALYPLVTPVGRPSSLGYVVHTPGAYLHLHPLAVDGHHRGVQRLVTVRFGYRDPIAHTVGIRLVEVGDDGVGVPALYLLLRQGAIYHYAYGEHVVDLLERNALLYHLAPNGVDRLGASLYRVTYACLVQRPTYGGSEGCYEGIAFGGRLLQPAPYVSV